MGKMDAFLWEVKCGGVVDTPHIEMPRFWDVLSTSQKEKWILAAFKAAYGPRVKILKRARVFPVPFTYYGKFSKEQLLAKYTGDMARFAKASKKKAKAKAKKAKTTKKKAKKAKTTKRKAGGKSLPPRK